MTTFQNIKTVYCNESPCSRWGHSLVSIQNHIYVFGGYENYNYYNDLWRFDLVSLAFEKVNQQGELPPPCSNFTLNYYERENALLLFGGGTVNKEKLNTIYKLDMSTFIWTKIALDQSDTMPWQRSYHCAEIIGHYLVITGGEFFHDLDDTWAFNLVTNQWKQIKLNEGALKPKARKFASSFTHSNKLYIIGGCSGKYECVDDCFEMDFTEFLQTENSKSLFWKIVQFNNKEQLVRWGHISVIKGNKAYVFGGRQSNKDFQNLVQIDILGKTCQTIEFKGQSPKGRRRPGICIKNNTLFCFSGFDGSYIKDFIYFNLPADLQGLKINQDTQGKRCLQELLTPNNVEQQCINFDDDVLYVTEEEFEKVEQYFSDNYSSQTVKLFREIDYNLSVKKLTVNNRFFANFFNRSYKSEQLQLYCSQKISVQKKNAISKMLATYFQFGKIVVPRLQFINSKQYFINLLEISEYYCSIDLHEICKKELLRFLHDEIISPKFNFPNIMNMCEVMANINKKHQNYAGYLALTKILQKNRANLNTLAEFKQLVQGGKQFSNKEWLIKMIEQHSFELSQLIMRKKEVDFENISCNNLPHKQEILYEKTRKGSMHSKKLNV